MKSLTRLAAVALALAGLTTSAHAAKKSIDFSEFKGNYTGSGTFQFGTDTAPCTASISVSVPRSGRTATLTFNGAIFASGTTFPISNTFTFTSQKTFTQAQLLYGYGVPGYPVSGSFTGKKTLTFSGQIMVGSTPVVAQSTLSVRPQGKKHRRLTLTTLVYSPTSPGSYTLSFDTIAKVKAPKK